MNGRITLVDMDPLTAQPGRKMPPIGFVSPLGVFRTGVAGVVPRLFAERRQRRRCSPLRDGATRLDFVIRR